MLKCVIIFIGSGGYPNEAENTGLWYWMLYDFSFGSIFTKEINKEINIIKNRNKMLFNFCSYLFYLVNKFQDNLITIRQSVCQPININIFKWEQSSLQINRSHVNKRQ